MVTRENNMFSCFAFVLDAHMYAHLSGSGASVPNRPCERNTCFSFISKLTERKPIRSSVATGATKVHEQQSESIRSSVDSSLHQDEHERSESIRSSLEVPEKFFSFMVNHEYDSDWSETDEQDSYAINSHRRVSYQQPNPLFSQITTKVPPMFDGKQSWFSYEEAIDDWTDITELEIEKQGAALRNRLEGEAAVYRKVLDRELLKQPDGVSYFKKTLRPYFVKGAQNVFLYRFMHFVRFARNNHDMMKWLTRFQINVKRLQESWNDLYEPATDPNDPRLVVWISNLSQQDQQALLTRQQTLVDFNLANSTVHADRFPLSGNLVALLMVSLADLTEQQRHTFTSIMAHRNRSMSDYSPLEVRNTFIELFCTSKTSLDNPMLNQSRPNRPRSFLVIDEVYNQDDSGYWVIDEEDDVEGFLPEFEDIFWIYDEESQAWFQRKFKGRRIQRYNRSHDKGKGRRRKGFRGRRFYKRRSRKGKGKGGKRRSYYGEEDENDSFWQDHSWTEPPWTTSSWNEDSDYSWNEQSYQTSETYDDDGFASDWYDSYKSGKGKKGKKGKFGFPKGNQKGGKSQNTEKPGEQNPSHYGDSSSSPSGPPKAIFFASDKFLAFHRSDDSSSEDHSPEWLDSKEHSVFMANDFLIVNTALLLFETPTIFSLILDFIDKEDYFSFVFAHPVCINFHREFYRQWNDTGSFLDETPFPLAQLHAETVCIINLFLDHDTYLVVGNVNRLWMDLNLLCEHRLWIHPRNYREISVYPYFTEYLDDDFILMIGELLDDPSLCYLCFSHTSICDILSENRHIFDGHWLYTAYCPLSWFAPWSYKPYLVERRKTQKLMRMNALKRAWNMRVQKYQRVAAAYENRRLTTSDIVGIDGPMTVSLLVPREHQTPREERPRIQIFRHRWNRDAPNWVSPPSSNEDPAMYGNIPELVEQWVSDSETEESIVQIDLEEMHNLGFDISEITRVGNRRFSILQAMYNDQENRMTQEQEVTQSSSEEEDYYRSQEEMEEDLRMADLAHELMRERERNEEEGEGWLRLFHSEFEWLGYTFRDSLNPHAFTPRYFREALRQRVVIQNPDNPTEIIYNPQKITTRMCPNRVPTSSSTSQQDFREYHYPIPSSSKDPSLQNHSWWSNNDSWDSWNDQYWWQNRWWSDSWNSTEDNTDQWWTSNRETESREDTSSNSAPFDLEPIPEETVEETESTTYHAYIGQKDSFACKEEWMPSLAVLDLGCTRAMVSREAANKFIQFLKEKHIKGIYCEFLPSIAHFNFANSETASCKEKMRIHFYGYKEMATDFEVLEQGNVPFLISLPQMRNLKLQFDLSKKIATVSSNVLNIWDYPLPIGNSGHLLFDLVQIGKWLQNSHNTWDTYQFLCYAEDPVDSYFVPQTEEVFQQTEAALNVDVWERSDTSLTRIHHVYRKRLCIPDAKTCPVPFDELEDERVTEITFRNGTKKKIIDNWRDPQHAQRGLEESWKGRTMFKLRNKSIPKKRLSKKVSWKDEEDLGDTPVSKPGSSSSSKAKPPSKDTYQPAEKEDPAEEHFDHLPDFDPPEDPSSEPQAELQPEERVLAEPDSLEPRRTALPLPGQDIQIASPAYKRMLERLRKEVELYKLHVKHYHMSPLQFKRRTSVLSLPDEIYEKYDRICKGCKVCNTSVAPPSRAKISGIRATVFGEIIFADHCLIEHGHSKYLVLLILDGATNLLWASPQLGETANETIANIRNWIEENNCMPRAIVADEKFHTTEFNEFYKFHGIVPYPLGPRTPWPNRAETAVRLFKRQWSIMSKILLEEPLKTVLTIRQLVKKCVWARNCQLTISGYSPLEIATGRKPPDLFDLETASPEQLTTDPSQLDQDIQTLQRIALRAHQEARQLTDLKHDLAKRVKPSEGPFLTGQKVFVWEKDQAKIKDVGKWTRGKVVSQDGAICVIDMSGKLVRVNQSKVRKDHDEWHDVADPLVITHQDFTESKENSQLYWLNSESKECHFLELLDSSTCLSALLSELGWNVGIPIDFKNGYKLTTQSQIDEAFQFYQRRNPFLISCSFLNFTTDETLRRRCQRRQRNLARFCFQAVKNQQSRKGYFLVFLTEHQAYSQTYSVFQGINDTHWIPVYKQFPNCQKQLSYYVLSNIPMSSMRSFMSNIFRDDSQGQNRILRSHVSLLANDINTFLRAQDTPDIRSSDVHFVEDVFAEMSSCECRCLLACIGNDNFSCLSNFQKTAPFNILLTSSKFVTSYLVELLCKVTALPNGTELVLHSDRTPLNEKLIPLVQNMRQKCLPSFEFENCCVYRGTQGKKTNLKTIPSHSILIVWNDRMFLTHEVYFVYHYQLNHDKIQYDDWIVIALWNNDSNSHQDLGKPDPDFIDSDPNENIDPSLDNSTIKEDMDETELDPIKSPDLNPTIEQLGNPDDPVFIPIDSNSSIPSESTELRPASISDEHLPQQLIHSKPSTPEIRPKSKARCSPIKEIPTVEPSPHSNQQSSSSHEPLLPISLDPSSVIEQDVVEQLIHDVPDDEDDNETIDYENEDEIVYVDVDSTSPCDLCYMNTSSFTIPTWELLFETFLGKAVKKGNHAEVSPKQLKDFSKQFRLAKAKEFRSWLDNKTIIFVDSRTMKIRNLISGRWVLTFKRDKQGAILSCKARWVARGFLDNQKNDLQTDSPTATRFGFRMTCQMAANHLWDIGHVDLKTAFLQGEDFDPVRSVCVRLPPDLGLPPYIVGLCVRPVYGLNDAPRRWWNRLDASLCSWGFVPTRADRCTYVLYDNAWMKPSVKAQAITQNGNPPGLNKRNITELKQKRETTSSQLVIDQTDNQSLFGKNVPKTLKMTDYKWLPVIDEELLKFLDSISLKAGWYPFKHGQALVSYRAKALRTSEPVYSLKQYPFRTSIIYREDFWHIIEVSQDLRTGDKNVFLPEEAKILVSIFLPESASFTNEKIELPGLTEEIAEQLLDYILDPIAGSNSKGRKPIAIVNLHVDDLFMTGEKEALSRLIAHIGKEYTIGSHDMNDVEFTGQRVLWVNDKSNQKQFIRVHQDKAIDLLFEASVPKGIADTEKLEPELHTEYRSILGSINWIQSRTQYPYCYSFSRLASCQASPTIGDLKAINKLVRQIRAEPAELRFWPLKGKLRLLSIPDAAYRNNSDKSSQRGHTLFIAEERTKSYNTRGSLIYYESTKIRKTTLSTTVAELYSLMKGYGTSQLVRGLWKDISGDTSDIHVRTDANNLVTTASTTHVPEQQETIHMIQMLRKEACSGSIADLAHIRTADCLADCLTKASASASNLRTAVMTGILANIDCQLPFRELVKQKAYLNSFIKNLIFSVRNDISLCYCNEYLSLM